MIIGGNLRKPIFLLLLTFFPSIVPQTLYILCLETKTVLLQGLQYGDLIKSSAEINLNSRAPMKALKEHTVVVSIKNPLALLIVPNIVCIAAG